MDFLTRTISEETIHGWELWLDDWFFVLAVGLLVLELIVYALRKQFSKDLAADTVTNFITLGLFMLVSIFLLATFYLSVFFYAADFAIFEIDNNWANVAICIVLADLAYYWEHRFCHRVNMAWATHSVHHSSPHFNISVAYRFDPFDGFWPLFFYLPLVILGFNPVMVLFAEVVVQLYQTLLHTEIVRKLPRPIEAVMNTASHHRVHHGSNRKYLDSNYGGIFIIWDRMFGTFVREDEKVVYGLVTPLNSNNPLVAFFHGFSRLYTKVAQADGIGNSLKYLVASPDWSDKGSRASKGSEV